VGVKAKNVPEVSFETLAPMLTTSQASQRN